MRSRDARLRGAAVVFAAAASACSSLRDGPLTATEANDADAAAGDAGGADGATARGEDSSAADDAGEAEAERDPEWAMWELPPSAPPAGNYAVADGVARDETTRLEWLKEALPDPATHAEAAAACEATRPGGGFRLPTRIELLSLFDYSPGGKGMNTSVFGDGSFGIEFWSSTPDALAPASRAWFVRFTNGESATAERGTMKAVRCVRGPAP